MDEDISGGSGSNVVDTAAGGSSGSGSSTAVASSSQPPMGGNTMAAFSAAAVQALAPGLFDSPMVSNCSARQIYLVKGCVQRSLLYFMPYRTG